MRKEIYLFTTIKEGSRNRLRPMPFQKDKAGKAIFTRLNVQGSTEMRETYPIGTVFASETIEIRTGGETPFYAAGEIFPVSVRRADLADPRHEPSPEMTAAYNTYMAANGDRLGKDNGQGDGAPGEGTAKGRPLSLLEKLRSNPRYEKPSLETDGFYVEDDIWWGLVTNLIDNENTLFKGPTGSGKTQIVRKACEKIGDLEGYSATDTGIHFYGNISTSKSAKAKKKISWVVSAKKGTTVTVCAKNPKAGTACASIKL